LKNSRLKLVFGIIILISYTLVAQKKKPNVIFIYADDLGRGLLGTYGKK
jgi:hypothetical protein